jgi:hypothetical protein
LIRPHIFRLDILSHSNVGKYTHNRLLTIPRLFPPPVCYLSPDAEQNFEENRQFNLYRKTMESLGNNGCFWVIVSTLFSVLVIFLAVGSRSPSNSPLARHLGYVHNPSSFILAPSSTCSPPKAHPLAPSPSTAAGARPGIRPFRPHGAGEHNLLARRCSALGFGHVGASPPFYSFVLVGHSGQSFDPTARGLAGHGMSSRVAVHTTKSMESSSLSSMPPLVELTIPCGGIPGRVEFPRALFQNGRIAYTIRKSQGQAIEENSAFQDAANDMAKLMCKVCSLSPPLP